MESDTVRIENGIAILSARIHALVLLLVEKGVLTREESEVAYERQKKAYLKILEDHRAKQ